MRLFLSSMLCIVSVALALNFVDSDTKLKNKIRFARDVSAVDNSNENTAQEDNDNPTMMQRSLFGPSFESRLQDYVNCQLGSLKTVLVDYGVPDLDQIEISSPPATFHNIIIDGDAQVRSLKLEGLATIEIMSASLKPKVNPIAAEISARLGWPNIKFLGNYGTNLTILTRPFNLDGYISAALDGLSVEVKTRIVQKKNSIVLQSLSIKPAMDSSNLNDGLSLNGVDYDSRFGPFENNLANFINANSDRFDQAVSPYIMQIVNSMASGASTKTRSASTSGCLLSIF